ncbi:MAG TPA: hypothetical protein VG897_08500 [Terriglobales bacterium]|nr:hypothetical protein [Terriglobales bacterium]
MSPASSLLIATATSFIAASGAFLALQQRKIAMRLFCAGGAVAAVASLISTYNTSTGADRLAILAALMVAAGLCAILILKARRGAIILVLAGVAGWIIASTFKTPINWLFGHWWDVPIALVVPCAAALIAKESTRGMRGRYQGAHRANSVSHFLSQLLDHLGGGRRGSRRRNRHIGDIGTTKRSRRGAGPNMI